MVLAKLLSFCCFGNKLARLLTTRHAVVAYLAAEGDLAKSTGVAKSGSVCKTRFLH